MDEARLPMTRDPRLTQRDVEQFHSAALEMADEARRIITPALEGRFRVDTKLDRSLVTDIDRAVERRLREMIERWFPDHGVIGEEEAPLRPESPYQWIIDPVDGTEELVHGIPTFGTMLALQHEADVVVGVIDHSALDVRVNAAIGIGAYRNGRRLQLEDMPMPLDGKAVVMTARLNFVRHVDEGPIFDTLTRTYPNHRIFRAAYAHTAVVSGAADVMVDAHNHVWDVAASQILIEEAGGVYSIVRDFSAPGGRLLTVVFGRPSIVAAVTEVFDQLDRARP
jgi:histidinol-phosphatase